MCSSTLVIDLIKESFALDFDCSGLDYSRGRHSHGHRLHVQEHPELYLDQWTAAKVIDFASGHGEAALLLQRRFNQFLVVAPLLSKCGRVVVLQAGSEGVATKNMELTVEGEDSWREEK